MNTTIRGCIRTLSICAIATVLLAGSFGDTAQAQSSRDRERSYEGENVDFEDLDRRQRSRELRRQIDRLPDDVVEALPIPILLGVTLDQLWPNFGDPRGGGTRLHEGFDMMAPSGTPIVSPTPAVVIRISDGANSGLYVSTANPGDETFVYMHLDSVADISVGDLLEEGDVIGYVGNTGNASGGAAHLHFEIRRDRRALDPFERIVREYTPAEQMEFLDRLLQSEPDGAQRAVFLADTYERTFLTTRTAGIAIPAAIDALLPAAITPQTLAQSGARDLTVGSQGEDVRTLQQVLIQSGHLAIATPTGYFGPLTQTALSSYQRDNGISPASGYFGPLTRAQMTGQAGGGSTSVATSGSDGLDLAGLIRLLLAMGVIAPEKEAAAYAAIATL